MFWKTFYNVINHWRDDLIYLNCRYTNSWLASLWASCKIFTKTGEKASAFTDRWVDKVTNFPQGNNSFFWIKGCPKKISALDQRKGFLLRIIIGEKGEKCIRTWWSSDQIVHCKPDNFKFILILKILWSEILLDMQMVTLPEGILQTEFNNKLQNYFQEHQVWEGMS